jgi:peptidyl-prolyl cis-trans isomerase D
MLRQLRSPGHHTKALWWFLTVVTVVTFLGGFVFIFGAGFFDGGAARRGGAIGAVNGSPISSQDYQTALNSQREAFRRQYGSDPADRDEKTTQAQAWRMLVAQRIMGQVAKSEGLRAHDSEVVTALKHAPPMELVNSPAFQTDGKFDQAKYMAALQDPNATFWASYEDLVRAELPARKLQERLRAALKLSEPELLQTYRERFDRLSAVVVAVMPDAQGKVTPPSQADLDRVYQEYKGRLNAGPRVDLEVLLVPRKYGEEDKRAARQFAQNIVDRARRGEDFAQLAKDYSEGPGASQGGLINRPVRASELGPDAAGLLTTLQPGDVSNPFDAQGRYIIFKLIQRMAEPGSPEPAMQLAQIVIRVRQNDATVTEQLGELQRLRSRAMALKNLGSAATEKGLSTGRTGAFDMGSIPPVLGSVPEAADWGFSARDKAVSPIFEGADAYCVVQVAERHASGPIPREQVTESIRQMAELESRVASVKPVAERMAQALKGGQTLEQAAQAVGATPFTVTDLTRAQPDQRLAAAPELIGRMFAARPGAVIGPVQEPTGWYFARVEQRMDAPMDSTYDKMKGQITQSILQTRDNNFFNNWIADLRMKAKVQDLRYAGSASASR